MRNVESRLEKFNFPAESLITGWIIMKKITETHIPMRFDKRQRERKQLQGFKDI